MMVDASALLAVLLDEPGWEEIAEGLAKAPIAFTTPLAIYETVVRLMRIHPFTAQSAEIAVRTLLEARGMSVVAITDEMTPIALDAFDRFGKGRHPAALNFGDCFAYACAKAHGTPLLYKGSDFAQTDLA